MTEQTAQLHATCIAIAGRGVLLTGPSGSGKSDLALRLIDRGARLVSDDYTDIRRDGAQLLASPPATIAGRMEVRGLGIIEMPHVHMASLALVVALGAAAERFPIDVEPFELCGLALALVRLSAHEASTPIKVEYALMQIADQQ